MMATQTDDPQVRSQQRIFLILPLFSLFYGRLLPSGLFIYSITTTIFSIVQQYLINGWGGVVPPVRVDTRIRQEPRPGSLSNRSPRANRPRRTTVPRAAARRPALRPTLGNR